MTVTGETGYLGLQGNLEENISQGNDIVMSAVLPGKPQMLAFICPETQAATGLCLRCRCHLLL